MKFSRTKSARTRGLLSAAAVLFATTLAAGCADENPETYDVTVSVLSTTDLNSLHFTLFSYFNDGDWIGEGEELQCTVLVDAELTSKRYGDGSLEIWLQNDDSFRAPNDVIRCALRTSETLRDDSFALEFQDATNFTGASTDPTVAITDISERP